MALWATAIHDGVYPSSSPTPSPKMCGCKDPEAQCVKLAIAEGTPYGWCCTKPNHVPALQQPTDCDRRIYDWKPAQTPQGFAKESKAPTVTDGKTADILAWTRRTLEHLQLNAGPLGVRMLAAMLLNDGDPNVSQQVWDELTDAMLDRLNHEKPWKRRA